MGATVSTAPVVMQELFNRWTVAMPDVMVTDGQPIPPQDVTPDLLCVGYTGIDGEPCIEDTRTKAQLTQFPDKESYDITCLASSWHGENTDAAVVRNACYQIINMIADDLNKDATIGGVVMRARVSADSFAQVQTSKGAVATIRFVIHVDAFTRNS